MRHIFFAFLFLLLLMSNVVGQELGSWEAYTSLRTINNLTLDNNLNVWAVTNGGVLETTIDGDFSAYTTIDGLSRLDGTVVAYDDTQNQLFIGYVNGVIDVFNLETKEVQRLNDIERSTNFTSKTINDFLIEGRALYVATAFGIVVYNMDDLFVSDSFIQLGDFTRAISVQDLSIANNTLYAGTQEGLAIGDMNQELAVNSNWETYDGDNGFVSEEVISLGYAGNSLYASTAGGNFIFENNTWTKNTDFNQQTIIEYLRLEDATMVALSNRFLYVFDSQSFERISLGDLRARSVTSSQEHILVGTENNGIEVFETQGLEANSLTPSGPYQNFFDGLKFEESILISASTQESAVNQRIDNAKGYYIFDSGEWRNFNRRTNSVINDYGFQQAFTSTITEEYYYFGSWGRGVARHQKETDEVVIFDETNSTLRGYVDDDPLFPVISGLATDSKDDVWIVSRFGDTPLYFQRPGDEDWIPFSQASAVRNSDEYYGLFIDSYDQKWISLQTNTGSGNGLLVLNTGNDSENSSDDASVKLTSSPENGNLPDEKVNAVIEDKNGEIWIGTGRGIARFIFPELIVEGGPNEQRAQWLINEDTTAASRFLLRDIKVSTMAINAANEKWIGTVNQGIWVLNADGSRIIKRFNMDNSPLFSNNIKSISINDGTGEVFISTESGLISYFDIPTRAVSEMNTLKVFPNPFEYSRHSRVVIEGLSDETQIKILGVDGTVVQELTARGGRTNWNGLDYNGNQLGTGVYFVVAYEDEGRENGIGKLVIVR